MADTISVRFERDFQRDLSIVEKKWKIDRSEVIRRLLADALREWKIKNALEEVREHKKSIGKAAEECGISLWELLEIIKSKNIDFVEYDEEDLKRDLNILRK